MSDIEYTERPPTELAQLAKAWQAAPFNQGYVAPPAPGYDVEGIWHCFNTSSRSGYSTHAVSLHWMLERCGVNVQLAPHRNLDIDIEKFPEDRAERLSAWNRNVVGRPHLMFVSFPPDTVAELGEMGPPLIPYCAFEGTKVSKLLADICNGPAFRKIWVVSDFVMGAMLDGGVEADKVLVVPPVLYGGPWSEDWFVNFADAPLRGDVSPDNPFTFGAIGTWHARKGFPDLIRAFWKAFKREDAVQLVLRTSQFGKDANLTIKKFGDKLTSEVAKIAREFGDNGFPHSKALPRIKVITGTEATDEEMVRWLGSLDCYANASYGEGLGIPHIWAKAQGVPMVSTGYGAVGELLKTMADRGAVDDELFTHRLAPIDADMVKFNVMFDRDCQWGSYEVSDLADAMTRQFERGRRLDAVGAEMIRNDFGVEHVAEVTRSALLLTMTEAERAAVLPEVAP